ncbi:MAG: hypothetical protein GXP29_07965, partial [Planctomycetes bacterium]|nr:hypothetical protein [Planctomycetota bacterium]
ESGTIDVGRFLADRWLVLRHLFIDAGSWPLGSLLFSLPILWLWFWYLGTNRGTTVKRFSCMAAIVLLGGALILYYQVFAMSPPQWLLGSNSLFTACPLLVLAFLKPRDRNGTTSNAGARLTAVSVRMMLAYAAAYALLTPEMHSRGVHWGCRYLLTIYPILIAVASIHIVGWWRQTRGAHTPTRSILLGLVVISFFAQLHSVRLMGQMKSFWVRLNETVTENSHEAIIATGWWIPMELSNCFEDKSIFLVRSQAELLKLRRNLRTAGTRNATILYSPPRPNAEQMGNTVVSDELHMFAVELDSARSP